MLNKYELFYNLYDKGKINMSEYLSSNHEECNTLFLRNLLKYMIENNKFNHFVEFLDLLDNEDISNIWKEVGNKKFLEEALNIGFNSINYNILYKIYEILKNYDISTLVLKGNVKKRIYDIIDNNIVIRDDKDESIVDLKIYYLVSKIGLVHMLLIIEDDENLINKLKKELFDSLVRYYPNDELLVEILQVYYYFLTNEKEYTKEEAIELDNEFIALKNNSFQDEDKIKKLEL